MTKISDRLKRYRYQKSYSLREVAEKLKVSQSTYRSWENGVAIGGEPYAKLAEIYEVTLHELMTGEESQISKQLLIIEEAIRVIRTSVY